MERSPAAETAGVDCSTAAPAGLNRPAAETAGADRLGANSDRCLRRSGLPGCCLRGSKTSGSEKLTNARQASGLSGVYCLRAQKRCVQRGSWSRGRRRSRFCARRTGFVACDESSVIGYWPALVGIGWRWLVLVMAGANNRMFWPSGDKSNDYSHTRSLAKAVRGSKLRTFVKNVQFAHAQRWFEGLSDLPTANNRPFCPGKAKTCDYSHARGLANTVRGSKRQAIVENVQFPQSQRWFEGLLDLLMANNRAFCPRGTKTRDYLQSTIAKVGAPECRGPKRTIIRGRV